MADYKRLPQHFDRPGQTTRPRDMAPPGRQQLIENLRPYTPGTLEVRAGLRQLTSGAASGSIHSLARLNDPIAGNASRIVGAGGNLYAAAVADPQALGSPVDSGYSGNPLTTVVADPIKSPRPYLYIADSSRQRKYSTAGTLWSIGLAQPSGPPSVTLTRPGITLLKNITVASVADWSAVGTAAAPAAALDVNTTVAQIAYDTGTTGWATISPTAFTGIVEGMLLTIDGEQVQVHQLQVQIADTTIAQIVYDSGTSGACQIQPAASLGTGQLEDQSVAAYNLQHLAGSAIPRTGPLPETVLARQGVPRIRQVDFPLWNLVRLSGTETTLIRSLNIGSDGIQSFRAITTGTHAAGAALVGYRGFRVHLNHTVSVGGAITRDKLTTVLTPGSGATDLTATMVGGVKCAPTVNAAQINGRATLADDIIHTHIRIDHMTRVQSIRLYLDIDGTTTDFLSNYYAFEWRASDLAAAIQATNGGDTATFLTAIERRTVNNQTTPARSRTPLSLPSGTAIPRTTPSRTPIASRTPPTSPTGSAGTTDQTITTQLALGDHQWIDLQCRITDLIRIGTDGSRTLADIKGVEILVIATVGTTTVASLTVDLADCYLTGGYGPDVGQVGNPYVYKYRYRSSKTGETSGFSPTSRGGALARRQGITVTGSASADTQGDLLDWFRLGGSLTHFTYSGTTSTTSFLDAQDDSGIDGGPGLPDPPDFQPWPVLDVCQTGVCTAAGGALQRTSGATFDTRWAPGTQIIVNGFTATIDQVLSSSVLLVVGNVGSGTSLPFIVPAPELLAQPLPVIWMADDTGVLFACGDPKNPGTVYWTKNANPDVTADTNSLNVTSAADPLQNGWVWDNRIYVASTKDIYELRQTAPGVWEAFLTAAGKGLWARWAFCVAPDGVYYLSDDGIYRTRGGDVTQSLTDTDLYDLFPHDGLSGRGAANGIEAPDLSQTTRLRLAYVDGLVYFDYASASGHDRTLIFDTTTDGGGWIQDNYATGGVQTRLPEPGAGIHNQIAARGAHLAIYEGHQDFATNIAWTWQSADIDGGDPRLVKQWGDAILDADLKGDTATITPVFNHGATTLTPFTRTGSGRLPLVLDIADGAGQLARSMGLYVTGSTATNPVLFLWEPAALLKAEDITRRATDWDDLGTPIAKFVQGVLIRANTYGATKTFLVQGDGSTQLTLNISQSGERTVAYPIASTGWTPFIAHLVRLWPSGDDDPFQLYSLQWIFEPAPELASEWTTQPTTHDFPGYLHVRDAFVSYSDATAAITMEILYDGVSYSTTITPSSTAYHRDYIILPPAKGRSVSYRWRSTAPFRLYQRDVSVRAHPWGGGDYAVVQPFGGPSRAAGAQV